MILECEMCATRYLVDTSDIGVLGRMVRCAECGHDWYATTDGAKPSPQAEPTPAPEPKIEPEDAPVAAAAEEAAPTGSTNLPALVPQTNDRMALIVLFWGAMVLALVALYLVFGRAQIMAVWPPAQHAFAVLGLEEPLAPPAAPEEGAQIVPAAFALKDIAMERVGSTITLTGSVYNEGGMAAPLPTLNIVEYDVDGNIVATTSTQLEAVAEQVAPGEAVPVNLVHGLADSMVTRVRVGIATAADEAL